VTINTVEVAVKQQTKINRLLGVFFIPDSFCSIMFYAGIMLKLKMVHRAQRDNLIFPHSQWDVINHNPQASFLHPYKFVKAPISQKFRAFMQ
jgi:hypothetical protein